MPKNEHAVALGRLGGAAGRGEAKAKGGRAAWANLSAEERSAELKRRALKRAKRPTTTRDDGGSSAEGAGDA